MSEAEVTLDPPPKPRRWLRGLLMLVIFLSGFVVGVGTTLILIRNQVQHSLQHPEEAPERLSYRVKRKLGLNEQQREEIEALIARRQQAIQSIRREFQPQFNKELDQLGEEIAAVLESEQESEWREWFAELRERWIPPLPKQE